MWRYILVAAGTFFSIALRGQFYYYNDKYYDQLFVLEGGLSIGYMNCLTDLGGRQGPGGRLLKDLNTETGSAVKGIYLSMCYRSIIGLRLEGSIGRIGGADSLLKKSDPENQRYIRNLHFSSSIRDLLLMAEFHPVQWLKQNEKRIALSPFIVAGIGMFHFNPHAVYLGKAYPLQPLRTEGQGFPGNTISNPYKLTQLNFPAGIGLLYEVSALIFLRLEMVYRFLKTDFLDDVSGRYIDAGQFLRFLRPDYSGIAMVLADRRTDHTRNLSGSIRGNPDNHDSYFSVNLKLGIALNRKARK